MVEVNNIFAPIKIGTLRLRNNLVAAPMAGLSALPYRILAMECGCALTMSEMVSAEGVTRAKERTHRYFANDPKVRPFGLQLFGVKPEAIAAAIRELASEPADLIDINMGCPVKKVVSKGAGAALMRDTARAAGIIRAAREATKLPLTVKMRAGWDADSINCAELARIAESCGADAVTVHARTRTQFYRGLADWKLIGEVKRAVSIPVIGNGDVKSRADAVRMISETGCDGVMIGRAALGNPWIFAKMQSEESWHPSHAERGMAAVRHLGMLVELLGERRALLSMRTILPWYGKGIPGIRRFLHEANGLRDREGLSRAIAEFFGAG